MIYPNGLRLLVRPVSCTPQPANKAKLKQNSNHFFITLTSFVVRSVTLLDGKFGGKVAARQLIVLL
ncbi:hypothetical protein CathTA2_1793 [Caldalkalibacillus thermarum TA2.A1]|uniref:Uncharacterized protein n=1 Tax=Caldalkalibacillus thermarum (strain TA2.A1) TaxID=986075 RepID=F5L7J3_CALTT|nr:hypothetical protein CathTA2_1793 [Caldalkalibacillus thermarum TA2.A1]